MKKCATPGCGIKELDDFYHDRTRQDRRSQYCKSCVSQRGKKKYKDDPKGKREYGATAYRKCKREVMNHYGAICQCCGEARLDFLTLDHIKQDGAEHRRKMGFSHTCTGYNFYLWLKKNDWPDDLGLQVLCSNCNGAKGSCGICPHSKEREANLIDGLGI